MWVIYTRYFYFDYTRAVLRPNLQQLFADTILNTRMFNIVYSVRVHCVEIFKAKEPKRLARGNIII